MRHRGKRTVRLIFLMWSTKKIDHQQFYGFFLSPNKRPVAPLTIFEYKEKINWLFYELVIGTGLLCTLNIFMCSNNAANKNVFNALRSNLIDFMSGLSMWSDNLRAVSIVCIFKERCDWHLYGIGECVQIRRNKMQLNDKNRSAAMVECAVLVCVYTK